MRNNRPYSVSRGVDRAEARVRVDRDGEFDFADRNDAKTKFSHKQPQAIPRLFGCKFERAAKTRDGLLSRNRGVEAVPVLLDAGS